MKFIDRFLRNWRVRMCMPYVRIHDRVLDIGCLDGHLLEKLEAKKIQNSVGLDPLLTEIVYKQDYTLLPGTFPEVLIDNSSYNCITLLAVLEHIPRDQQAELNAHFFKLLKPFGRVIITVPSAFVDRILPILSKFKLIDGMSLEEHYGFETNEVPHLFHSEHFKLVTHKKFQLGLNNLFVFEKIS